MAWRAANSLLRLQDAVNAKYTKTRNKSLDAFIGDQAHASRKSDHNPNSAGVVCAYDITLDPAHGADMHAMADYMRTHMDKRVQYIISNKRIANPDIQSGAWRPYNGASPHSAHIHVSVKQNKALYDNEDPWDIGQDGGVVLPPPTAETGRYPDFLQRGALGEDVEVLQWLVGTQVDGDFGPKTHTAVRLFQANHALEVDGIVGHLTWDKMRFLVSGGAPPEVIVPPPAGPIRFSATGKMSTFGGPNDTGVTSTEGLALYNSAEEATAHGVKMLSIVEARASGLARRLDPAQYYLACRWNYDETPRKWLQDATATVSANGKSFRAKPVDWGPNVKTGRVTDLSPGLATALGLKTDDTCKVEV